MLSAHWNGSAATLSTVGTLGLALVGDDRGELSWSLPAGSGSEPFERLRYGAGAPTVNLTGIYHHAAQTGWGMSFEVQGATAATVLYFYDDQGRPTWALGTGPVTASAAEASGAGNIAMLVFPGGSAPNDHYLGLPGAVAAGSLSFDTARLVTDVFLPGGGGSWQRDVPPALLTSPGPVYLEAGILGPGIIPSGANLNYSATVDTNIADAQSLQYAWSVVYSDRIASARGTQVNVQPGANQGLISVQLQVSHAASGRSDFTTRSVSVQNADRFEALIVPEQPIVDAGVANRFAAAVVGGRAPYVYEWDFASTIVGTTSTLSLRPSCSLAGPASLLLTVTDADARTALASYPFVASRRPCVATIAGPGCLDAGVAATYEVNVSGRLAIDLDGGYAWASSAGNLLHSCLGEDAVFCEVFGIAGSTDEQFTLAVAHPATSPARRAVARSCGDRLRLAITSNVTAVQTGAPIDLQLVASGGRGPYRLRLDCGEGWNELANAGAASASARCVPRAAGPGQALISATVFDALGQRAYETLAISLNPASAIAATLTTPNPAQTCLPLDFSIAIVDGIAPFNVGLDFGDGSQASQTSSQRNLVLQHTYAPASGGTPRQLRLVIVDAIGARGEVSRSLTPVNAAAVVSVVLRNAGFDNIHIYDRASSPAGCFDLSTRLTPGATRTETLTIPASVCEASVDYGAGRGATPLTATTCTFSKSQSDAAVTYRESAGPALSCN